jgi:glucose-6-phosphate isomerase
LFHNGELGITINFSKIVFSEKYWDEISEKIATAYREMAALEAGEIANKDENRMTRHYWLRYSKIASSAEIQSNIDSTIEKTLKFTKKYTREILVDKMVNLKMLYS